MELNKKYLITTDSWFFAPDGVSYKAVYGTVTAILSAEETLGVKPNRNSASWYVIIGNMYVAGCQIHYAIQTDRISITPPPIEVEHNGTINPSPASASRIYLADEGYSCHSFDD